MATFSRLPVLSRHLPTWGGIIVGGVVAAATGLASTGLIEHLVWTSGVAALLPAAQPPLGITARLLLALGGGVIAGAVVWSVLFLVFGPGGFLGPIADDMIPTAASTPSVRRADAHPDAPPRRPMTAADLGTPLMEVATTPAAVPVERPLPTELDQPLAAFDPAALPATAREPQRVLPALAPGERLDTFELVPPPSRPNSATIKHESSAQSVDALLRRLEAGAGRRAARV